MYKESYSDAENSQENANDSLNAPKFIVSSSKSLKLTYVCNKEEPRVLGLVMVPGRHIVSIHLDDVVERK
ncbi:hypothetical protein J437_LFUL017091 [Ladona fulva]|uniref:Uncharacterized protein n=1 Tax=Ladona fulva TaxID=123851 RepID=A0A8K0KMY1_LADFU|nr:hypothetical protein J437_LFUL017091 [Ladona fulva]